MPINYSVRWSTTQIVAWQRAQLEAAGESGASVPDEPFAWLTLAEVKRRVRFGRTTIYERIRSGTFPKPITMMPKPFAMPDAASIGGAFAGSGSKDGMEGAHAA